MPESNVILRELDVSVTADTEYRLPPGKTVTFTLNGTGVWEFWDGGAWVAFTSGSGKNFTADIPHSGRVRINVTSGTVLGTATTKN